MWHARAFIEIREKVQASLQGLSIDRVPETVALVQREIGEKWEVRA
jgi:hypothetical protein